MSVAASHPAQTTDGVSAFRVRAYLGPSPATYAPTGVIAIDLRVCAQSGDPWQAHRYASQS